MSLAKTVYLFRCGESGLYAFTADPSGHILPSRIYPQIRWRFERRVTLQPDRNSSKRKIVRAILDAIAALNFGALGYLIVGMFLLAWAASVAFWKFGRIEQRFKKCAG